MVDGEYMLLGTVPLEADDPAIDLNQFGDTIKAQNFGIVLNKHSAETLDGSDIDVDYDNQTLSHTVETDSESNDEYKFTLAFGV